MTFAYLRDGDAPRAFENAQSVGRAGLYASNELVRAVLADRIRRDTSVAAEGREEASLAHEGARRNCELQTLLAPDLYEQAVAIVTEEHAGDTEEERALIRCPTSAS
ncbi:MAG: hypothetical protein AB7O98_16120 [Hyphomonadaceae bacterium]